MSRVLEDPIFQTRNDEWVSARMKHVAEHMFDIVRGDSSTDNEDEDDNDSSQTSTASSPAASSVSVSVSVPGSVS